MMSVDRHFDFFRMPVSEGISPADVYRHAAVSHTIVFRRSVKVMGRFALSTFAENFQRVREKLIIGKFDEVSSFALFALAGRYILTPIYGMLICHADRDVVRRIDTDVAYPKFQALIVRPRIPVNVFRFLIVLNHVFCDSVGSRRGYRAAYGGCASDDSDDSAYKSDPNRYDFKHDSSFLRRVGRVVGIAFPSLTRRRKVSFVASGSVGGGR